MRESESFAWVDLNCDRANFTDLETQTVKVAIYAERLEVQRPLS